MLEATARPLVPALPDAIDALEHAVNDVGTASRAETSAGALMTTLRLADTLNALAVGMLQRLAPTGEVERDTGLPIEMSLRLESRRARWDARELMAAADQLGHMPATHATLDDGSISWSQARAILRSARDLDAASRAAIDRLVQAQARALTDAEAGGHHRSRRGRGDAPASGSGPAPRGAVDRAQLPFPAAVPGRGRQSVRGGRRRILRHHRRRPRCCRGTTGRRRRRVFARAPAVRRPGGHL